MNLTSLERLVPAYVLALFDGEPDPTPDPAPTDPPAPDPAPRNPRDPRGRFTVPDSNDPAILRNALHDAARDIEGANSRISELNAENTRRRNQLNETRTQLGTLEQRQATADARVIRSEAREALRTAGVVAETREELDDLTTVFLRSAGNTVAIDAGTGEPTGITAALESWRTSRPTFFKKIDPPADPANPDPATPPVPNRTGGGPSPTGGGGNPAPTPGGLPDLRTLTPAERKAAIRTYRQSQHGAPTSTRR